MTTPKTLSEYLPQSHVEEPEWPWGEKAWVFVFAILVLLFAAFASQWRG